MTDRDTQTSEDDLLLIAEAALVARCSQQSLRRWADAGKIHAERTPGGLRLFRRGDLEQLVTPGRAS